MERILKVYGDSVVTVTPERLPQALFLERIPRTHGDSVVTVAPKRLPQALFLERIPRTHGDSVVTAAPEMLKSQIRIVLRNKKGAGFNQTLWSSRPDLNRRPARYECAALPTEPRKHITRSASCTANVILPHRSRFRQTI